MFFIGHGTPGLIAGAIYTLFLLTAAVGDMRKRRIPNRLVAALAALGLAFGIIVTPTLAGAFGALGGLLTGLVLWLPFYVFGWLGAGDVKLYAAAGAWLGPLHALEGALIAAVAGAVLALVWMVRGYGARNAAVTLAIAAARPSLLASNTGAPNMKKTLPYGVALAIGAIVAGWAPGVLLP